MKKHLFKLALFTFLFAFTLSACTKKEKKEKEITQIDVATQWQVDIDAYPLFMADSGQWKEQAFSETELNLFAPLDTANLAGSTMPANWRKTDNYPYPNPFHTIHVLQFKFNPEYAGDLILKYVVVDQHMIVRSRQSIRLTNGKSHVGFKPDLDAGQYRLYYTLSAEGNPHFYKSWGNIEHHE